MGLILILLMTVHITNDQVAFELPDPIVQMEEDMHKDQLKALIESVLPQMGLYSEDATALLMGTAAVESNMGYYLRQIGGPARGIFQMEPETEKDIWDNYLSYHQDLRLKLYKAGYVYANPEKLLYDLKYQIIMARLHYRRFREPIPSDIDGQAKYWKKYYNTEEGAGTIYKYMEAYALYVIN